MADPTDGLRRLAEVSYAIFGIVSSGEWARIPDQDLRDLVRAYVADACRTIASAGDLDEAMEYAHDVLPARLPLALPANPEE